MEPEKKGELRNPVNQVFTKIIAKLPYHVKTIDVNHHFSALKFVQLFTDGSFLLRR